MGVLCAIWFSQKSLRHFQSRLSTRQNPKVTVQASQRCRCSAKLERCQVLPLRIQGKAQSYRWGWAGEPTTAKNQSREQLDTTLMFYRSKLTHGHYKDRSRARVWRRCLHELIVHLGVPPRRVPPSSTFLPHPFDQSTSHLYMHSCTREPEPE